MKHVTHRFYSITLHCCTNILYWYDQHKSMQFDNHNLFRNFQKSSHSTLPWENHRVRIEIKFSLNFLNRDYFDSSIFQIISCCLGFCLKRLFLTLLPSIFCTFFRTFAWLLNVIVSLLIQYTTKQFTITNFFLDPLTKIGITFFFSPQCFLVPFFLVIVWKIPLPMIPNLNIYEFCLLKPLLILRILPD